MPFRRIPLSATCRWRPGVKAAIAATAVVFSVIPATSSIEQDLTTPFEFFDQSCLAPGADFRAMSEIAATRKWSPLPDQVLQVLTPIASPTALLGWIASGDNEKIKVVVISKGSIDDRPVKGCTVGFYGIDTRAFENAMASRAGPGTSGVSDMPDRINIVFNTSTSSGAAEFVRLSLPATMERQDQVIASVLMEGGPDK